MRNKVILFCITTFVLISSTMCFWIPGRKTQTALADNVNANAKGECVVEMHSRRILYARDADVKLPMASTTKILTAITVLENCSNLQEKVEIPAEAVGIEGSSVYLKTSDDYTVEDLLYGLMLRSGNDCAVALALHCANSLPLFLQKMNHTAQKAGALQSSFQNPHGLHAEKHYTTARDLSYITCYALKNETFCQIVSTKCYEKTGWRNKNKMLKLYEGSIGVKTGYTRNAGKCLVSAAKREGMTLVCTLLNCPNTYERTISLLNDAYKAYTYEPIIEPGQVLKIQVNGKEEIGLVKDSFSYPLLQEEKEWLTIKTYAIRNAISSSKNEKIIGKFEIYLAKDLLFSGNLYKL